MVDQQISAREAMADVLLSVLWCFSCPEEFYYVWRVFFLWVFVSWNGLYSMSFEEPLMVIPLYECSR